MAIDLSQLLPVPRPEATKVKFNIRDGAEGAHAWELFRDDDQSAWREMNQWRTKHPSNNFGTANQLLTFVQYPRYGTEFFVFGGFFDVKAKVPDVFDAPGYDLTDRAEFAEYVGRLVLRLHRPIGRNIYLRWFESLDEQLEPEVYEIMPPRVLDAFPGYQNVRVRHRDLAAVIRREEPHWAQALSRVKAVYAITDTESGQIYIGSASGDSGGLWQRWTSYADLRNLTGDNVRLEALRAVHGDQYLIDNLQYSILEIFDPKTSRERILEREYFWMSAFCTREHGLNGSSSVTR